MGLLKRVRELTSTLRNALAPRDLQVRKIGSGLPAEGVAHVAVSVRPADEPLPPPPLEVRGPGWFVIRYASTLASSPLPEFDLIVPADADGGVDSDAWKAARERTVATRPSDGQTIGLFRRRGHHWMLEFEPGAGPGAIRMGERAACGAISGKNSPFGDYHPVSFAPLES